MSNIRTTNPPRGTGQSDTAAGRSTAGAEKEHAADVGEATSQVKDHYATTTIELREQADVQQRRVASGLHSVSDEL